MYVSANAEWRSKCFDTCQELCAQSLCPATSVLVHTCKNVDILGDVKAPISLSDSVAWLGRMCTIHHLYRSAPTVADAVIWLSLIVDWGPQPMSGIQGGLLLGVSGGGLVSSDQHDIGWNRTAVVQNSMVFFFLSVSQLSSAVCCLHVMRRLVWKIVVHLCFVSSLLPLCWPYQIMSFLCSLWISKKYVQKFMEPCEKKSLCASMMCGCESK